MSAVQQWEALVSVPHVRASHLRLLPSTGTAESGLPVRARFARRRFAALLVLLVVAGGALLAGRALAASDGAEPTMVTVRTGDTLSGLAQEIYPDLSNAQGVVLLQHANNLGGAELFPGERLLVPAP